TGRRVAELDTIARRWADQVEIVTTRGPGDGILLAAEAAVAADRVIAVGGDGTANEVVNGLMEAGRAGVAFGALPAGTGSDLVRTLRVPAAWDEAIPLLLRADPRASDVLDGRFVGPDGVERRRWAINVIGLGLAGDVVRRVNQGSKVLGGRLTFLGATLAGIAAWRSPRVSLTWVDEDGAERSWSGGLINVFLANGQYCGGGMWVGPEARMDDGLIDVAVVPHQSVLALVARTPRLYDGTIGRVDAIRTFRARELRAEAEGDAVVLADADGEQPGRLPARVVCRAGALAVCSGR
ncbi:MAG TPA: diacylglycerol kinase family protein, partial [Myxococcota bacterium]|nr:diacylglycerol kinase family protein [Myxococcota bacterium]